MSGKMSRDRVHFTVGVKHLRDDGIPKLLYQCFEISSSDYQRNQPLRLIARPSQFARFVILLHKTYRARRIKLDLEEFDVELVSEGTYRIIDCSNNPNMIGKEDQS